MAKPRRTPSRPPAATKKSKAASPPRKKPGGRHQPEAASREPRPKPRQDSQPERRAQAPERRSTYADAIAAYERGLEAIQRHEYRQAAVLLQSVLHQYPEEKELHERVRLYLQVCERHLQPVDRTPRTSAERVYGATLAVNAGAYDQAVELATAALAGDEALDAAEYILSVALALRGDTPESLAHLRRAIELNPDNREIARRDPDLDALRRLDEARGLLDTPSSGLRRDRRSALGRSRGLSR
jgi:tetratricopeptide (TPR) repeat protein